MRRIGLLAFFFAGCMGSASIYYQDQKGGVLALHHNEERALRDAQKKMAAHCGAAGFQIVKRETVVVGRENYATTQRDYGEDQAHAHAEDAAWGEHTDSSHQEGSVTDQQHQEGAVVGSNGYVAGSQTTTTTDSGGDAQSTTTGVASSRGTDQSTVRGGETTQSVAGTRDVTETRITYVCGSAPSA